MRQILLAASLLAFGASAAQAAPAPPSAPAPQLGPPRVFAAAGYAQPEIGADACKTINDTQVQCLVPAMTAGSYMAKVEGASTAQSADAVQQIIIVAGDRDCTSTRQPDPKQPWAVGARRSFASGCVFTIVSDTPVVITGVYRDAKATKDPKGPTMTLVRVPWRPVLVAAPVTVTQ